MKKITILFLFLLSLNSSAQDILGEWYLHYIIDLDNNTIPFDDAPYANLIFETTTEPNTFYFSGFGGVFNDFGGSTSILEPTSFISDYVYWTLGICDNPSLCYLEEAYQLFWDYNSTADPHTFNYTITGSGSEATLIIYNTVYNTETGSDEGYYATYSRQILSLEENTIYNSIKLVENPVKQKLLFNSKVNTLNTYKILSLDGKVVSKGDFENEIHVDTLEKGLYLIDISSSFGSKQLIRFVKK